MAFFSCSCWSKYSWSVLFPRLPFVWLKLNCWKVVYSLFSLTGKSSLFSKIFLTKGRALKIGWGVADSTASEPRSLNWFLCSVIRFRGRGRVIDLGLSSILGYSRNVNAFYTYKHNGSYNGCVLLSEFSRAAIYARLFVSKSKGLVSVSLATTCLGFWWDKSLVTRLSIL